MMRSFAARLAGAMLLAMLSYGLFVAWLFHHQALRLEHEGLQRVAHGLAGHIVRQWPQLDAGAGHGGSGHEAPAAREAVLAMLRVVNPAVQVYVLDADGGVAAYLGEPGMVQTPRVDLDPIRRFLAAGALPLRGTDPMGGSEGRLFSAAMFPPRPGDSRPPGYLYIVLDRPGGVTATDRVPSGGSALVVVALGLAVTLALAGFALLRLTRPLQKLARTMNAMGPQAERGPTTTTGDEVQVLQRSLMDMTSRLQAQQDAEREQAARHRETLAGIAHDLRTPLTALHGHLEALGPADAALNDPGSLDRRRRLHASALQQSEKVRRLSQQLFELATLQATDTVIARERFRLDELVGDTVQKFELDPQAPGVCLAGDAPGRVEVAGDLQLVERALTNLIDNARRHGARDSVVRVGLRREGGLAQIWVDDQGPGLPAELNARLQRGQSLREPPIPHPRGGMGGLGLAIAQRVALLHGGRLRPLPKPDGGTRLCLELPTAG